MLSQKTKAALAKAAGIEVSVLTDAISGDEEKDLELKTSKHFTEAQWEAHETAIDTEKQGKYEEGREVGQKGVIKEMKETLGLNYEGRKPDVFIEKFKSHILEEAGQNPDKRVQDLEKDLKTLREVTLKEKEDKVNDLQGQINKLQTRTKVLKHLPKTLPEGINQEDALTIIEAQMIFEVKEGKEVVKRNGEILKNDLREPLNFETAISDFATERKWRTNDGGRGGEDEPGGDGGVFSDPSKARKASDLNKYFEKNGIHPAGEKAQEIRDKAVKSAKEAKEDFEFDD